MKPEFYNRQKYSTISETVLIPFEIQGVSLFSCAYYSFAQNAWILTDNTGTMRVSPALVKEWWPLPSFGAGLSPDLRVIDGTIALVREYEKTQLKLAIYSAENDIWMLVKDKGLYTYSIACKEWYPLPNLGTGIPSEDKDI